MALRSPLAIGLLYCSREVVQNLTEVLQRSSHSGEPETYQLLCFASVQDCLQRLQREPVDCLLIAAESVGTQGLDELKQQKIFLPVVVLTAQAEAAIQVALFTQLKDSYHAAAIELSLTQLDQLNDAIDQAISQFIQLR